MLCSYFLQRHVQFPLIVVFGGVLLLLLLLLVVVVCCCCCEPILQYLMPFSDVLN